MDYKRKLLIKYSLEFIVIVVGILQHFGLMSGIGIDLKKFNI